MTNDKKNTETMKGLTPYRFESLATHLLSHIREFFRMDAMKEVGVPPRRMFVQLYGRQKQGGPNEPPCFWLKRAYLIQFDVSRGNR
jgi:uncharacterized protein YdiU (UPF0061 family)